MVIIIADASKKEPDMRVDLPIALLKFFFTTASFSLIVLFKMPDSVVKKFTAK